MTNTAPMSPSTAVIRVPLAREAISGKFPPDRLRARVKEAIDHWIGVANRHAAAKGLPRVPTPPLKFDLRGRAAGMFRFSRRLGKITPLEIDINIDLLVRYPTEMIQQTVPHEVAHAVVCAWYPHAKAHGREFQFVMEGLFQKPADRTHSMEVRSTQTLYRYVCACPGKTLTLTARRHNRLLREPRMFYSCRSCGARITFSGQEVRPV